MKLILITLIFIASKWEPSLQNQIYMPLKNLDDLSVSVGATYGIEPVSANLAQQPIYQVYEPDEVDRSNNFQKPQQERQQIFQSNYRSLIKPSLEEIQTVLAKLENGELSKKIVSIVRIPTSFEFHLQEQERPYLSQQHYNYNRFQALHPQQIMTLRPPNMAYQPVTTFNRPIEGNVHFTRNHGQPLRLHHIPLSPVDTPFGRNTIPLRNSYGERIKYPFSNTRETSHQELVNVNPVYAVNLQETSQRVPDFHSQLTAGNAIREVTAPQLTHSDYHNYHTLNSAQQYQPNVYQRPQHNLFQESHNVQHLDDHNLGTQEDSYLNENINAEEDVSHTSVDIDENRGAQQFTSSDDGVIYGQKITEQNNDAQHYFAPSVNGGEHNTFDQQYTVPLATLHNTEQQYSEHQTKPNVQPQQFVTSSPESSHYLHQGRNTFNKNQDEKVAYYYNKVVHPTKSQHYEYSKPNVQMMTPNIMYLPMSHSEFAKYINANVGYPKVYMTNADQVNQLLHDSLRQGSSYRFVKVVPNQLGPMQTYVKVGTATTAPTEDSVKLFEPSQAPSAPGVTHFESMRLGPRQKLPPLFTRTDYNNPNRQAFEIIEKTSGLKNTTFLKPLFTQKPQQSDNSRKRPSRMRPSKEYVDMAKQKS